MTGAPGEEEIRVFTQRLWDADPGLHAKYDVERIDDKAGKHDDCDYFVLDLTHDVEARRAAKVYAHIVRITKPRLSRDLQTLIAQLGGTD